MAKRCVRLTFSAEVVAEPITYNLGHQFNVVTNIRRADVAKDRGWIVLELDGEEEDVWVGSAVNIDYPFSLIIGTADDSAAWGFWSGVIDEVKILNKTLTAAEILEEFES